MHRAASVRIRSDVLRGVGVLGMLAVHIRSSRAVLARLT
jgi:hypothetical protein